MNNPAPDPYHPEQPLPGLPDRSRHSGAKRHIHVADPRADPELDDDRTVDETASAPIVQTWSLPALPDRRDWLYATVLTVLVAVTCFSIADTLPSHLLHTMDFWFEADTIREVSNMTSVHDDHYRTSVHPLFSLFTFTPVFVVKQSLGLSSTQAVLLVTSVVGGLWMGTLYFLLRLTGCRRLDACVFTALAMSSASALFWLPIPNSFSWGSLSVMLALCLLLVAEHKPLRPLAYVVTSALTLSFTVTNWMAGLLVTLARWPWKQGLQLSVNAFCLVVLIWGVQKFIFPTAEFFLGSRKEVSYVSHPQSGGVDNIVQSFFYHSVVAPAIRLIDDDGYIQVGDDSVRLTQRMTVQFSRPGSSGPLGVLAVVLWSALLMNGLWRLVTVDRHARFRLVLVLLVVFELSLHLIYGEETFTYGLQFMPLLLAVVAYGTVGPHRPLVLGLAALLAVCAGVNNWQQLRQAVDFSTQLTLQRDIMTDMMRKDPNRPWPRAVGHVVLAAPGTPEADHAYHEPGGDFSPRTPSFGVSFWLCDANGRPVVTSQTLPLSDIQQVFEPSANPHVPDIVTRTPYYEARWSRVDSTHWRLRFKNHTTHVPAILIRSVGPAGGPVTSLAWDGEQVTINKRWTMNIAPAPATIALGDENAADWMTRNTPSASWEGKAGWGFARVILATDPSKVGDEYQIMLSDVRIPLQAQRWYRQSPDKTTVDLPEPRFKASMQSQATHLMMSLVAGETRPGDPTYFYRAWHRQSAYIVAALARAGDSHTSRVLSRSLAMHDFVGGSGAEADEPGLTIWSLTEAAKYIADDGHDNWLWPHIRRKAHYIEDMLTTNDSLVESSSIPSPYNYIHGQRIRQTQLAKPAQDGLIVGRVGDEWPVLYVNAVSYRGLIAAAEIAERLGKPRHAARWRRYAQAIQGNWQRHFLTGPIDAKVYTVGLWPSLITGPLHGPFGQHLSAYRPTTLASRAVAEELGRAHQHLRLGQPDVVWKTLQQIWDQQASPGLYTWEVPRPATDDVADGWQYSRGWHNGSGITPDYESAALLLLLQQDMLAYVDEAAAEPTVIIGAGIPTTWLSHPMSVSALALPGGSVDWQWDGRRIRVRVIGSTWKIRLGSAFPPNTKIAAIPEIRNG